MSMTRWTVLVLTTSWFPAALAQLVVTNTQTPAQLVQNVLLGNGIVASNVTFNGVPANTVDLQVAEFDGTNTTMGIGHGLMMATGNCTEAIGPNNTSGAAQGGGFLGQGDPDLLSLAQATGNAPVNQINDAAVLEFDFVPTGDSLKFDFVFASDEYLEFVQSYNDVFGFFLSGPGLSGPYSNGAINIALVPNTMLPVAISTVNNVSNAAYYIDNGDGFTAPYNTDPMYIQYDGLTTVLTARAEVICGQTYHIKLAIGDANDTAVDSGVFLEAGSFQSNAVTLASQISTGGIDSLFYEGCGTATLYLVRGAPIIDADSVQLVTAGTATPGIDYTALPPLLYFAPGQDSLAIPLSAFLDGITEGQESIQLMAIHQGNCGIDTSMVELLIDEPPPIDIILSNDTNLTCNDSALVTALVSGGYGSYVLDWDQGIPDGSVSGWVHPLQTTTYTLTVMDDCGVVTASEHVTITVPIPPPLVVTAVPDIVVHCPETIVTLQAQVQGGDPGYTYQWSNGLGVANAAQVAPATTQSYTVFVTDACGRDTSDMVTVTVDYDSVAVRIAPDTTICINDTITLHALPTQGWGGYTYLWDNSGTADSLPIWPQHNAIYGVTVTDGCGISASDQAGVGVNAPMAAFAWDGTMWVNNFPIAFLDQSFGATSWSWDFGWPGLNSTEQFPHPIYPAPGQFDVMLAIMDTLGCRDTTYRTIEVLPEFELYIPNSFTPNGDGINDLFRPSVTGVREYQLRIFDRWGELLFQSEDPSEPWDGVFAGAVVSSGVYVYQYRVKALVGEVRSGTGTITVLH
ncbi:MAG: choice-of-anchor L domain-containing protein [Flavobacteriales bacterium]|nr:choice-of-anchor L domain-containing protein [Flavobacteriales bacterium]